MRCARCHHDHLAGAKFCIECGMLLKHGCPRCGAESLPRAKFCGACGLLLMDQPPAAILFGSTPRHLAKRLSVYHRLILVKIVSVLNMVVRVLCRLSASVPLKLTA